MRGKVVLSIDSGNTNIVFSLADEYKIVASWRIATNRQRTADEYGSWLLHLMSIAGFSSKLVSGIAIASVVPETIFPLETMAKKFFDCTPIVVNYKHAEAMGIKILIDNPPELGADRIVNVIAAHKRYPLPQIIVDLGTATTLDVVNKHGHYIGGSIAPGLNLSLEALYMAAAKLPRMVVGKPEKVIATATVPAMQAGIFWGYIGLIEGLVSKTIQELGAPATVIATGGLAPILAGATKIFNYLDENLTMLGITDIYYLLNKRNHAKNIKSIKTTI